MMHRVNGAAIFVEDTGGPGQPVVFLHGFLFDGRMFDSQVIALRDRYRCITIDFPGQGRSEPAAHSYQLEQLYADVLQIIHRLDVGPVHLVGLSMGGFVAMRLTARNPELVRSVTLLNTGPGTHPRAKVPQHVVLAGAARMLGPGSPVVAGGLERALFGEPFRADPASAQSLATWRRRWAQAHVGALISTLLALIVRPGVEAELPSVTADTLIISGQLDLEHPPADGRRIAALVNTSRMVVLPGVGHSAVIENPDAVTAELRRFLTDVDRSGGMSRSGSRRGVT